MSNDNLEKILQEMLAIQRQALETLTLILDTLPRQRQRNASSLESLAITALHLIGPNRAKIAAEIGCSRQHLYNLPRFCEAYELAQDARKGRTGNRRGFRTEDRSIEAWEE